MLFSSRFLQLLKATTFASAFIAAASVHAAADMKRTVIFMYGKTTSGQDMFLRGGIDSTWSNANRGTQCTSTSGGSQNLGCSISITHLNTIHQYTQKWRTGDLHLDWGKLTAAMDGREAGQGAGAAGTPLVWTSNDYASTSKVSSEGAGTLTGGGFTPLNIYGGHYWMLDVMMDCSQTVDGWFELKSFISNGPGWEGAISQAEFGGLTKPAFSSKNHVAYCGKINTFRRNENGASIRDFPSTSFGLTTRVPVTLLSSVVAGGSFPNELSQTGIFASLTSLSPVPGVIPYKSNSPLWSDGAIKSRWIAVPGNEKITFNATGPWAFPVGTVFVKHFAAPTDAVGGTRNIETRILVRTNNPAAENDGWVARAYQWNLSQTEAYAVNEPDGADEFGVLFYDAAAGYRTIDWHVPGPDQCFQCHQAPSGRSLGVKTLQLNGPMRYGNVVDNQLRAWNNIGLFTTNIGVPSQYKAMNNPADSVASLGARAKAYFDSNCSHCHQPGSTVYSYGIDMDLRYLTTVANMKVVDQFLRWGSGYRVKTGSASLSVLWQRMNSSGGDRMPRLGSVVIDDPAVDVVKRWIEAPGGVVGP